MAVVRLLRAGICATLVVAGGIVVVAGLFARPARADREPKPSARPDSVRNFELDDLDGKRVALADLRDAKAIVLAWTAPGCPVAMVYAPRLAALAKEYADQRVRFLGVASDADTPVADTKALAASAGFPFPVVLDKDGALAQRLSVATTTTVVVLDENWRVRYRGAVDDQYAVGTRKDKPAHRWLVDALEAVLSRQPVSVESSEAPGCPITFAKPAAAATADAPTWSGRVASIVHRRCVTCHQPGQGGPFPLRAYEDARSRTATMRAAVAEDRMPPWHAVGEKGRWLNDRRLDADEKRDLLAWIDAGAPAGDLEQAPAPPPVPAKDAWDIGTPDVVLSFDRPQAVPAEGVVPYRYIEIPTSFDEDRWVSAVEVSPGAPDVVHHVLVAAVPAGTGGARGRRANAFAPTSGFFAAMVPGARGIRYPDGMAKRLPKGSTLLFQMHYTPNGIAQEDRTRIGMIFSKAPPQREVFTVGAFAVRLEIPPGAKSFPVEAALPVPWDVRVLTFMPHMHLRGASFRYAVRRFGEKEEQVLCDVPKYDFNWQTPYRLTEPVRVRRGSFLHCTATFDNSADNPYNPDPTATVRWGDQTWDEMMIGYLDYVKEE